MENQNLKTKFIRRNKLVWDKVRHHRYIYSIPHPDNIYKKGFCNIRCKNQDMIDSIELNIDHKSIAIVNNDDGLIFQKLRDLLNISDESIVPCLGSNNFIPFLKNGNVRLFVDVNDLVICDMMDTILTYDEVEISDSSIVPLYQYPADTNIYSKIMTSVMYAYRYITNFNSNNQICHNIKCIIPTVEFTSTELGGFNKAKIKLNFSDGVNTLLIYTPNNKVIDQYLQINGYNIIDTTADIQNQFTVIKLNSNHINNRDTNVLCLELHNVTHQAIYIYAMCTKIINIKDGMISCIE